ncbi:hypothetical protein GCM10010390_52890 [Streptomyces mordarskii]|uniref:Uncharacterized protein n=1 Tax=Streptomyces mordarskii TaxID=1226758 RepID=A0ABN1DJ47_9ACTN
MAPAAGLSGEGEVVEAGDAEHRLVDAVAFETAVAEDLPALHPREGVLDAGAGPAMDGVLGFLCTPCMLLIKMWGEGIFLMSSGRCWSRCCLRWA